MPQVKDKLFNIRMTSEVYRILEKKSGLIPVTRIARALLEAYASGDLEVDEHGTVTVPSAKRRRSR